MFKILAFLTCALLFSACRTGVNGNTGGIAPISSSSSALSLGLRSKNGLQFSFYCPTNISFTTVWGTDLYTDDSSICTAAVHAGRVSQVVGGVVTIEIAAGFSNYVGTTRNGVTTTNYGSWDGSYFFR